MDRIEYNGQIYTRAGARWVDDRRMLVHESLQNELDRIYLESVDVTKYSVRELIAAGDKFKESSSFAAAIKFYENAIDQCDSEELQYILPRITSCYRQCKMARKAIRLFAIAKEKYGEDIITPPLLTSVAAAYCDLMEYENALRCCKWSYKKHGRNFDPSLQNVYARIKRESGLQ